MNPFDNIDIVQALNDTNRGWTQAMGIRFVSASPDEISAQWTVAEHHLQPFGIVHGGVHAGVIETLCSMGAGIAARARGHAGTVVGLENHTSFIRAVRAGAVLTGRALPITRGRTTHVWEAKITDEEGRLVAQGTVRLLCVDDQALPNAPGT